MAVKVSPESIEAAKAMQRILKTYAGYTGEIDGNFGALSRAAMARFMTAHNGHMPMMPHVPTATATPSATTSAAPNNITRPILSGEVGTTELPASSQPKVVDNRIVGPVPPSA